MANDDDRTWVERPFAKDGRNRGELRTTQRRSQVPVRSSVVVIAGMTRTGTEYGRRGS